MRPRRSRRLRALAAGAALATMLSAGLASCGEDSDRPANFPDGDVDEELAQQFESLGVDLYFPDLRGSSVQSSRYDDETPAATTDFGGLDDAVIDDDWSLRQSEARPKVRDSICSAINPDNTDEGCSEEEGWAYDDYEGDTSVYVLRGATLLTVSIETEDDDLLTDQTVQALLDAPRIRPEDLARS